ncbi:tetratricopeptide repeat protein [Christiangramia sabulilitoris]|uniref:Tetratricopeptide repeat protein n=1 Tax=Christiangramia sabulilitoris TaxID=2583991 RepID=A0A550I2N3_9FLAO|nr:tetratricopeptide repeat protein [Christiangramia sabulilitoris]TRO65227.1 tetratricopeptide repeat protein [Christiangramia sabulilitoris]
MKAKFFLFLLFIVFSCKNSEKEPEVISVNETPQSKYGCAPTLTDQEWYQGDNKAPLFEGLNAVNYPVQTTNPEAQRYFNQGLVLAYGFNHAEAARSFYYATKLDPQCAMCYWGFAYVLGPNYNAGMEDDNYERAYDAIQKAKEVGSSSKKEMDLINAMAKRYVKEPVEDRSDLDVAYSKAMHDLHKKYLQDEEIAAIYAESLLDMHPWDLFDKQGQPKEWTPEIVSLLENILRQNPKHPGANHFYIHAVEASNTPERANASAKIFDDGLVPGAGHLVHMPSHVYIRTGEYHKGTLANIRAVEADSAYVTQCHAQGAYPLAYYPHNYHFLAATATLQGNAEWAMIGAQKLSDHVHPDIMKEPGWGTLQHYYSIPLYVQVKLGRWDEIINSEFNTYDLPYLKAVKHYARGMAYMANNDLVQARSELADLEQLADDKSLEDVTIWDINSVSTLMQIAKRVLKAEILANEGKYDESLALLNEAVEIEDSLNYDEPPDWFFSVRHHLGAVQIEAGKYKDAIATYEEDLKKLPKNGWAQHGMRLAYENLNDDANVQKINQQIKQSWKGADIEINSSRIK